MREQKCRLIDDDVIVGFVDHFESGRVILRRNNCHVGLGDASHSGFDLWKRGRNDRLFVSFSRPTTAISNAPRGNDRVCSFRDYDRRFLQQVFAARKSALASRCVAAIYFPLLIAGGVRLAFGCSPFPHLVGLSWSIPPCISRRSRCARGVSAMSLVPLAPFAKMPVRLGPTAG